MKTATASIAFVLLLSAAAAFEALSSRSLPPVVASHFAAGGSADGFLPRGGYVALMLSLTVGLPLLLVLLSSLVRLLPPRLINLPARDYWLAPERSAETRAFLQWHGAFLGVLLALFLCFVHWLVVRANALQPPVFPESPFFAGLALFLAALVTWIGVLVRRFRRRS